MADDEKWGLSREEIDKRVRELNQKKKAQGPTRRGRSSGQGVKFLGRFLSDFSCHNQTSCLSQKLAFRHEVKLSL